MTTLLTPTPPESAPSACSPLVDLGDGYIAVPYEAVTLNGMFLPQLLASARLDAWAALGPDRRALQGESGRPYRYETLEECRADVATLKRILGEANCPS